MNKFLYQNTNAMNVLLLQHHMNKPQLTMMVCYLFITLEESKIKGIPFLSFLIVFIGWITQLFTSLYTIYIHSVYLHILV